MSGRYERIGAGRIKSAEETADSRRRVRGFWHRCDYARGTPAAAYLARRGLSFLDHHDSIRFRADCPHPSGARLPAMVVLIHDRDGAIAAVHRTFLNPDGTKAEVDPVKATMGAFSGGAIRLYPAVPELIVAEGLETAASAAFILGQPAWAAIACGNLRRSCVLPSTVQSVIVAADHDGPGRRAAAGAARRWRAEGRAVRVIQPDRAGQDFNDLLRARAADAR